MGLKYPHDYILRGEIVEQGSHTELLNMKNGLYKKLYQTDY
ncbi:hypothetical protein BM51_2220 [Streptococcus pneumoniae]|nr:hypothetical protein SP6UMMC_11115 [Streptococcus pneumoniae MNZ41]KGI29726.1 hypothetical protein BM51_2220 [Streptococcus pneumoniae]